MFIYQRSFTATLCLCILQITLLLNSDLAMAQNLKDVLDSYDAQLMSHFNLTFTVSCKTNIGADQDPSTFTLQMTGNDGKYALFQSRGNLGTSRYTSKADPLAYNSAGDLIVSNLKSRTILNNGTAWKVRSEYDNSLLNRTGGRTISSNALAPRLELYPANHQDGANLFFRYVLTLGRGYSQLLDTITSSTIDSDGIATVVGPGSLFSSDKGMWRMEIDTKHDYLVQVALFTLGKEPAPVFSCRSNSYWKAETPLFAKGILEFPKRNYRMTTALTSYAPSSDPVLYDKSTDTTTTYPPNTSIMDFSRVDAEGMPFVLVPLPKDMSQDIIK